MITYAVSLILIVLAVHITLLVKWRPLFDDPDHFAHQEINRRDHVAWAHSLVVGDRPIRSWTA